MCWRRVHFQSAPDVRAVRGYSLKVALACLALSASGATALTEKNSHLRLAADWTAPPEEVVTDNSASLHPDGPLAIMPSTATSGAPTSRYPAPKSRRGRHIDIGLRWARPRLGETKKLLDQRLETPLRLDWAQGFEHPYTPIDRNTDWGFVSLYLGFGREVSDWLIWDLYVGGSAGKDRNDDRVLMTTLDVNFEYRFLFMGFKLEVYPWKIPHIERGMNFEQRLKASRPFIVTGLETGYVHADGEGTFRVLYVPVYKDSEQIRDWVNSFLIGLGWDFPITPELSFNVVADYKFHFYRPDEYNGWNILSGLRYRF